MKCGWTKCKDKATHYLSVILDVEGETRHVDDYYCDDHTAEARSALKPDQTLEYKEQELAK